MYKIGDKLKLIKQLDNFNPNKSYEIATQRLQDGKFVIFNNNEPICFDESGLKFYFVIEDNSINNGGSTDYYKFKENWKECADIIEDREMNYNQGNIFKSAFCFNIGRHNATDYQRELNKIIYFANRELKRIEKENL